MIRLPHILPGRIHGNFRLPVSKSMANRLLMLKVLSGNRPPDEWDNAGNDYLLLRQALSQKEGTVQFEDAGTPLRFFLVYAAVKGLKVRIDGSARLRERPLQPLIRALESLGAKFRYHEKTGGLPLSVEQGADTAMEEVRIDRSLSSQFVSALMLMAPAFNNGLRIIAEGVPVSEPYVDMTATCLTSSGIETLRRGNEICVRAGVCRDPMLGPEADWSAACFLYAWTAAAEEGELLLEDLKYDSRQGDSAAAEIFRHFGVESIPADNGVLIRKKGMATVSVELDLKNTPDMFPVLVALCAVKRIPAVFTGTANLRLKESDRIRSMKDNLLSSGSLLTETGTDRIELTHAADAPPPPYSFRAFGDHRIAMACSLFAFLGETQIDDAAVVNKSFPSYWELIARLYDN